MIKDLLLSLLVLNIATSSRAQQIITNVTCSSHIITPGGASVALTPVLEFHFKLNADDTFESAVHYANAGWVALGFGTTMIGSSAIIAVPPKTHPNVYSLTSNELDVSGVLDDQAAKTLKQQHSMWGEIGQRGLSTTMTFTLDQFSGVSEPVDNLWAFIFAAGKDNTLGLHAHRGAFRINLNACQTNTSTTDAGGVVVDPTTGTTADSNSSPVVYNHKAAFAAHAFFATAAFAIIIPLAVGAAWFRTLWPKWWVYIHVLSNCLAFFFTLLAVATAFAGMVLRGKASGSIYHMSIAHHWVGFVIFLLVSLQVVNGFKRPALEHKADPVHQNADYIVGETSTAASCCFGYMTKPESPREKWHLLHQLVGITVLALALYQLSSGVLLYTTEYGGNTHTALTLLWVWIACIVVSMLILKKLCVASRATKHSLPRNLMPQREEDEDDDYLYASSHAETRRFNNVI